MPKILLTNYYNSRPLELIKNIVPLGFELIALDRPGQEEVIRKAGDADYLLVGGRNKIDQKLLDAAPKIKMIQRSGVGLDSLDIEAIRERRIPVYVNEGINSRSVAEHTLMLILGTLRKVAQVDSMTRAGQWVKHDIGISCHDLYGKQVGLIGFGNIGLQVAKMLRGFGVDMVYYKRNPLSSDQEKALDAHYLPLMQLLSTSDIISLHCPLNAETKGLLGYEQFAIVKSGAVLINTARGGIVVEDAFMDALNTNKLSAAGLDVFENEPIPRKHPLLKLPNVILTPHISSITAEAFTEMIGHAFKNIALFNAGEHSRIEGKKVL